MIYTQFPDLQWLKQQAEKRFADRQGWAGRKLSHTGWPTVILNVQAANIHRDNIRGPLSIFTNVTGSSTISVEKRSVRVDDDFFFVSNSDQHYTLDIEKQKTETFNIHFGEHFSEQVFDSWVKAPGLLLDNEFTPLKTSINFYNRLHHKSSAFRNIITSINISKDDSLAYEANLFAFMSLLLQDHRELLKAQRNLPALKNITRHEITRRLLLAVDYINSYYDQDLSLDELAQTCCLSKFHFLRLFKIIFNTTPHQYVNAVRTTRAKDLLKHTNLDVKTIAQSVGFRDASTFSRMFRSQVGAYPTQFRSL